MKRFYIKLALLIALLVLVLVPLLASCGDDNYVKKDGFTYYDGEDGTYTLVGTKYDGKGENSWPDTIEIPAEVDGHVVDAISGAFKGCYSKKVVLPETITYIGESFIDCYRLETLKIPEATVRIVDGSFKNCPKLVESGDGFDYVGKWAVASNAGAVLASLRP
ncbi:MAG: leucine-rich repeat protein, partial [Clostridia bacterium]|nr:leucine-rich repeat protein [Clostridia bacterium]